MSRAERVSLAKITLATKRKISLMGSQAVKLMSEQQIASIGEDLQYFWQILMSRKPKIRPNSDPVPSALTLYFYDICNGTVLTYKEQ